MTIFSHTNLCMDFLEIFLGKLKNDKRFWTLFLPIDFPWKIFMGFVFCIFSVFWWILFRMGSYFSVFDWILFWVYFSVFGWILFVGLFCLWLDFVLDLFFCLWLDFVFPLHLTYVAGSNQGWTPVDTPGVLIGRDHTDRVFGIDTPHTFDQFVDRGIATILQQLFRRFARLAAV